MMVDYIPVPSDPLPTYYIPYSKKKLKALGEDNRLAILTLLSQKPHSINELKEALETQGIIKTINTIRHHVDVLKKAGLVSLVGLKEGQGGTLKYYGSTSRLSHHEFSISGLKRMQVLTQEVTPEIAEWTTTIFQKYKPEILKLAKNLQACDQCDPRHFVEYILTQMLMNGLGQVLQDLPLDL